MGAILPIHKCTSALNIAPIESPQMTLESLEMQSFARSDVWQLSQWQALVAQIGRLIISLVRGGGRMESKCDGFKSGPHIPIGLLYLHFMHKPILHRFGGNHNSSH